MTAIAQIHAAVATALHRDTAAHNVDIPVLVALSGGRDSVVLLHALHAVAARCGRHVRAAHVHHGLSAHAGAWAAFCSELCVTWGVALDVAQVAVSRAAGTSLEAEARRERYAALAAIAVAAGARHVALAHHRDDQAETLLLQLLRGAGPRGLAAMPARRVDARGVTWWRPLLDIPRATIDAYANEAGLRYVDDESNERTRHRRNALRRDVMPLLEAISPGAVSALARAARHQAEASQLADDLARLDAAGAIADATLEEAALSALAPHRARNLLRWFLREQGLPAPSTTRLAQMLQQITGAPPDARVDIAHGGVHLGLHRGRVHLHAPPSPDFALPWRGEDSVALPHGTLAFARMQGAGLGEAVLAQGNVTIRRRAGGERFCFARNRPRRALKSILHDAGWPAWQRQAVPLVFCNDTLVAVPGVGIDPAFAAAAGATGIVVTWTPRPPADYIER